MNLAKPVLEELFNKQIRFKIPVFQRHYTWNEHDQLTPLWDDIVNKFNERNTKQKPNTHYTGSIVLFQELTTASTLSTYSVIDGQQRLTTFQIFITAFREICRKYIGDENLIKELDKYLINEKSYGDKDYENQKFKLDPTKFDKDDFRIIVSNSYEKVDELMIQPALSEYGVGPKTYRAVAKSKSKILTAYLFFYEKLDEFLSATTLEQSDAITIFLLVIKRDFQFVEINLTQQDDPQMIFETMNGRGASLTETDLIRNYIFMRANSKEEDLDTIYNSYWNEFDDPASTFKWHDQISRGRYFKTALQFFVIDYLTLKLQSEIRYDQVFYNYKIFILNRAPFSSTEEELKELNKYGKIFKNLIKPEGITTFDKLAQRLSDLGISTAYPLLLFIEADEVITKSDKEIIYKYLDSYITRRFLCGLTTKNYNNVFVEYLKFVFHKKDAASFCELLKSKSFDTNLWPTDNLLAEKLSDRPLYREEKGKSKIISNIFLEIEHHTRGNKQEQVKFKNEGLTIEHLLPQTWYEYWPINDIFISEEDFTIAPNAVMLEEDKNGKYHKIENRNRILNTIGNLTVLTSSLNPSISNNSFDVKKKELAQQATIFINTYFQDKPIWDEDAIKKRSEHLFSSIKLIWPY